MSLLVWFLTSTYMYQYKQQSSRQGSRRRRGANYILPFVIIALLVGIVWAAWSLISRVWVGDNQDTSQQAARLMIDSGSVKVMMADQDTWGGVVGDVDLYSGEKVKIGADGQASLFFSSDMELRLNRSAEVTLTKFDKNEASYNAEVQVDKGLTWASLGNLAASNSTFGLTTQFLSINADSAKFAVEAPGTVYMLEGNASVEIMDGDKPIKSIKLGVGQQLVVDEKTLAGLKNGTDEKLIFAMDGDFKRTGFYLWNAEQEGWTTSTTEDSSSTQDTEKDPSATDSDTEKDTAKDTEEDKTTPDEEETVTTGKVEITSPSKEATYESTTMDFNLEGNVPSNTAKVVINGSYTLQQYKAGSTTAKYYVREATGNVKEGKNVYSMTAYDKNDKKIGEDSITVNVKTGTTEEKPTETSQTPSSGTVSITSPSSNATYESSTSTFDIKASVPSNTAKVVVNDYTLGGYSAGSTSAIYHVKSANGNVKEGDNTYTVTAYDKDNTKIGQDSITVTVKSSSTTQQNTGTQSGTLSLSFDIPSPGGTYSTSLTPIKIGGSVSSDIRNLYVNDTPLSSHALGNATWEKSVDLKPGLNTFKIYGENALNDKTSVKTLTIDYQGA